MYLSYIFLSDKFSYFDITCGSKSKTTEYSEYGDMFFFFFFFFFFLGGGGGGGVGEAGGT